MIAVLDVDHLCIEPVPILPGRLILLLDDSVQVTALLLQPSTGSELLIELIHQAREAIDRSKL